MLYFMGIFLVSRVYAGISPGSKVDAMRADTPSRPPNSDVWQLYVVLQQGRWLDLAKNPRLLFSRGSSIQNCSVT
ncbi:hypothetical protein F4823DRAFT_54637 [Ustulina deusta]|nr:hypothetical protein F4823DRAFT_54637 [Ustulina deusta]